MMGQRTGHSPSNQIVGNSKWVKNQSNRKTWIQMELFPKWTWGNKYHERPITKNPRNFWFVDFTPTLHAIAVYNRRIKFGEMLHKIGQDYDVSDVTIHWVVKRVKKWIEEGHDPIKDIRG